MRYVIYAICALSAVAVMVCVAVGLTRYIVPDASCQATDPHTQIIGCTAEINKSDVNSTLQDAYFRRGWAELRLNQPDLAIADETKALSFYPLLSGPFAIRGEAYGKQGQWQSDIVDQNAAIALNDQNALAYFDRGYAEMNSNLPAEAVADFTADLQLNPKDRAAFANRALLEEKNGDLAKAVSDASQAIAIDPSYLFGFSVRAAAYEQMHKWELAIADQNKVIASEPNNANGYLARGYEELNERAFAAGIADSTKSIALNPNNPWPYINRALMENATGKPAAGVVDGTKAIALAPSLMNGYVARGEAYGALHNWVPDIADQTKAISLNGGAVLVYLRLGIAYAATHQPEKAIAAYTSLIQLAPTFYPVYSWRAALAEQVHDYALSTADYQVLAAASPKSQAYLNDLCWNRTLAGDPKNALGECITAISLNPKDPAVRDSLGFVYLKLKQFDAAIAAYSDALKLAPKAASSLYGRALAEQALGELPAAKADFAAAAAIDPAIAADFGT